MLVYTAHRRIGFVRMLISMAWLFLLLGVPVAHAQAGGGAKGSVDLTTAIITTLLVAAYRGILQ